jgi:hypothetical protein
MTDTDLDAIERAEAAERAAWAEYEAAVAHRDLVVASSGLSARALSERYGGAHSNWYKKIVRGTAALRGGPNPATKRGPRRRTKIPASTAK